MAVWQPKFATAKNNNPKNMLLYRPKAIVNIMESRVRYIKNGLRLSVVSEIAPKSGAEIATKNVEMPKTML